MCGRDHFSYARDRGVAGIDISLLIESHEIGLHELPQTSPPAVADGALKYEKLDLASKRAEHAMNETELVREAFATILVSAVNTARYKRNRLYRLVSLSSIRRLRALSMVDSGWYSP